MEGSGNLRGWAVNSKGTAPQGRLTFLLRNIASSNEVIVYSSVSINDGSWHHCVCCYDGGSAASGVSLYIDGVLDASPGVEADSLTATIQNAVDLNLGARENGVSNHLLGDLDEVAVYDKVLTSLEVREIYGGKEPNDISALGSYSNCVAWWRMGDGDTFPTLTDNAGSYDGTMTNMESGDIVEDTPEGDYTETVGGGEELITYYRMRARDSGAAPPGYVAWTAIEPDFIGSGYSGGTPTPIGPMIAGSVVKLAEWS
jgi:hypothetical protein